MKLFQNLIFLFCICVVASCKEEYYPKVKPSEQSLLVVEGFINTTGQTNIHLTRSSTLNDVPPNHSENGATVTVESASGTVFPLTEQLGKGIYAADQLNLDASEKYRLHIYTAEGKEYASDYLLVQKNAPIDSVSWQQDQRGITIYVNTHDPENNTRYYRWEFEETWQIRSSYFSYYKLVNGVPVERHLPEEQVYYCWKHFYSSELILGTTTQLTQDVVSKRKLIFIPDGSDKLSQRYSVLVRQFALTKEAYAFYELLKNNTESLGSIFSAQPSELTGNIHSLSDSTEKMVGFVTIASGQEVRIFITPQQVPRWNYNLYCINPIEVANDPDSIQKYFGSDYSPYDAKTINGRVLYYYAEYPECSDCTLRGGSTEKPSFW